MIRPVWRIQIRENMKRAIYLLVITLIMSSVGYAQGILNSGTIDGMINWTVYEDGRLTLDGSGSIADYSSSSSVPWYQNRTAITSIELSGSISSIGKYAFYACTNVTQITSNIVTPPTLATNTFNSSRLSSITLYVPSMYISDYQTAEYWSQMQVQSSDGGVVGDSNAYVAAIYVDGMMIDGFEPYTFTYQVELPEGTTTAPDVTYILQDESCMSEVQQADSPNGMAKITVTSSDGSMTNTYQIIFSVQEDLHSNPGDDGNVIADGYFGDGDGLHWLLYGSGQLTIDGVGDMPDFSDASMQPWATVRDQIYDVNFNAQTTKVGNYAFAQCSNLNTVTLASTTNQLGDYAFSECPSLTRITIPANEVISSSELAFGNSFDREKMTIEVPEALVDAYKGAMFWYEFNIVAMGGSPSGGDEIVDGLVEGDMRWSFNSASGLLSIYGFGAMPNWIQSMAPWGDYVEAIQEVDVCYGITYVCNGAFANCPNITKVTIAASVDSIGEYIFTSNNSPIQFYVQNMTPPGITSNTFANVNGCVYAYCYESAYAAYESHPFWSQTCLGFDTDPEDPNLREYQLQMIYINNIALDNYDPNLYNYNITLPSGSSAPLVTYKPGYTSQSITVEQASSPDGKAYIHVNGSATYSLYFAVDGGGSQQGDEVVSFELDENWKFIMLPTVFGLTDDDVTASDEIEWATYSGMQRASGRSGWVKVLSSATANGGVAYIVRAKNGSATLNMNVPASASSSGTGIALTLETHAASHEQNANWNFIGNPYNVGYNIAGFDAMGITSPITVWNGTGYSTYTPGIDEYILQPFEPFFIQIPDDGSVSELMLSPEYFEGNNGSDPTGGNEGSYTFTFITQYWDAAEGSWMSGMNGSDFIDGMGLQCTTLSTGANAQCPEWFSNISTVIVTYTTSGMSGAGSVMIEIDGINKSEYVAPSGDTELRELTFDFVDEMPSGKPSITVDCTEDAIYIYSVTIITK